ncbi:MAG: Octaprenyl diphosphate synthase [Fimbriimonadaceae bacterium]|nr:Octaprenyl diphosphate synthase [Fimbriimonadaceae bacterium]
MKPTAFLEADELEPYLRIVSEVEAQLGVDLGSRVELVEKINRHILEAGGKRLRPAFVVLSAEATGRPFERERAIKVGACMELIHMATLIHDDVIDETPSRRGRPTASSVYGNTASILSGDVCLAKAMVLLAADGDLEIIRRVAGVVEQMAEGEVREIETRGNFDLDRMDHFAILAMKTADFIACCCEVGAMIAGADSDVRSRLRDYGFEVGMAFQLIDDVLDYAGDPSITGKAVWTDFREGCATLPLIELRKVLSADEDLAVRKVFGNGVHDEELIRLSGWMQHRGAIREAQREAEHAVERAIQHLSFLPDGPAKSMLIASANRITTRQA